MLCEHVRHEGIVSVRYVVLWTSLENVNEKHKALHETELGRRKHHEVEINVNKGLNECVDLVMECN